MATAHASRNAAFSFGARIGAGFAATVFAALLVGAAALHAVQDVSQVQDSVFSTYGTRLLLTARLQAQVERRGSDVRAYLLTGDRSFLESRVEAVRQVAEELKALQAHVDTRRGHALLQNVIEAETRLLNTGNAVIEQYRVNGDRERAVAAWADRIMPARAAMEQALDRFYAHQDQLLEQSREAAAQALQRARWSIVGITGGAVLLALVLAYVLSRTLTRAQLESLEAIRARDEFLTMAAHDLRSPLAAMQLQLDTAVRAARRDNASGKVLQKLQEIDRQLDRQGRLVATLLDVSRMAAGRLEVHRRPHDLGAVVRAQVDALRPVFDAANTPLHVEVERVEGMFDRDRVEQVINNLLTNAVKFGEGRPVELTVRNVGGWARIVVKDGGRGIAPEDHARIFQRFERAVSARHHQGMGLGLWMSAQLCQAMHGSIGVQSAVGQGAVFTVELPLQPRADREERHADATIQ